MHTSKHSSPRCPDFSGARAKGRGGAAADGESPGLAGAAFRYKKNTPTSRESSTRILEECTCLYLELLCSVAVSLIGRYVFWVVQRPCPDFTPLSWSTESMAFSDLRRMNLDWATCGNEDIGSGSRERSLRQFYQAFAFRDSSPLVGRAGVRPPPPHPPPATTSTTTTTKPATDG